MRGRSVHYAPPSSVLYAWQRLRWEDAR